ncbi:MAG: ribosome maturation factor RimM [Acidimicrobiales bacterium]|nr:ribosome maturation factor RimM [Acidimicrobiales bacterium]
MRGEVIVELVTDRVERLAPGSRLRAGDAVVVVEAARPHQRRWIVSFEGVATRTGAEALHGTVLRAEPLDDPAELWVHELVGAEVVEVDGRSRGRVTALQANPASDLLVLDTGALVPVRFVVDHAPGRVVVEVPPGLFEL